MKTQTQTQTNVRVGGGYCVPAGAEMVGFMFQVVDALKRSGKNAACLFLSYGTCLLPPQIETN